MLDKEFNQAFKTLPGMRFTNRTQQLAIGTFADLMGGPLEKAVAANPNAAAVRAAYSGVGSAATTGTTATAAAPSPRTNAPVVGTKFRPGAYTPG